MTVLLKKSPFHFLLSVIIFIIIVFNVALYQFNREETRASIESGETYNIGSSKFLTSIDKVDSEEFISSLTKDLKDAKSEEILEQLKNDIQKENKQKFIDELKKSIEEENAEKMKEELKKSINDDYTKAFLDQKTKSYQLLNDMKAEYLLEHRSDIQDYSVLSAFKELIDESSPLNEDDTLNQKIDEKLNDIVNKQNYYKYILEDLLLAHKPTVEKLTDEERGHDIQGKFYRHVKEPAYSDKVLREGVKLKEETFKDLQDKHDHLVAILKNLDFPPTNIAHGDGIVVSGGGIYLGGALVAIGQIREMGSVLPIELVVNSEDEYDAQICEELLPNTFNAKCVVIERELGKPLLEKLNLKKFQMKVLGLFVSSFDNIIALDADNLPLKNVDTLLTSDPFITTKFVLWPDIWHKSTSPQYYDLARIKLGEPVHREGIANDWSYHDYIRKSKKELIAVHDLEGAPPAMSVETGQIVFSKRAHFRSFVLALYYNIFGPTHYYRMFFQGFPGEGDRETFIPAMHVFKEPYHLVKHDVWLAGYKESNGFFQETCIVQYDPQQSIAFFEDWEKWLTEKKGLDPRLWPFQDNPYTRSLLDEFKKDNAKPKEGEAEAEEYKLPDVLFLHSHKPKINPVVNAAADGYFGVYTRRNFGLPDAYTKQFGTVDWELKFHTISKWVACKGITSESFWNGIAHLKQEEVCKKVTDYVEFLKKDSKDLSAGDLKYLNF